MTKREAITIIRDVMTGNSGLTSGYVRKLKQGWEVVTTAGSSASELITEPGQIYFSHWCDCMTRKQVQEWLEDNVEKEKLILSLCENYDGDTIVVSYEDALDKEQEYCRDVAIERANERANERENKQEYYRDIGIENDEDDDENDEDKYSLFNFVSYRISEDELLVTAGGTAQDCYNSEQDSNYLSEMSVDDLHSLLLLFQEKK